MRAPAAAVVILAACGRIGFDPPGAGDVPGDSGGGGDGDTCASARIIAIGVARVDDSIAAANDDYPGSGCGNGPEVVYAFEQPTSGTRRIELTAAFRGAAAFASACPPVAASCGSVNVSVPLLAEQGFAPGRHYIVIDKTSGAGTTLTLLVQ